MILFVFIRQKSILKEILLKQDAKKKIREMELDQMKADKRHHKSQFLTIF